jgi:hypothetical protein
MIFLELFVPRGAFSAEQLRELAGRLTMRQLLTHADAIRDVVDAGEGSITNPGVMDFVNSVNHVVVHEIGTWIAGGRPLDHAGPPGYLARAYVPGPWRKARIPPGNCRGGSDLERWADVSVTAAELPCCLAARTMITAHTPVTDSARALAVVLVRVASPREVSFPCRRVDRGYRRLRRQCHLLAEPAARRGSWPGDRPRAPSAG